MDSMWNTEHTVSATSRTASSAASSRASQQRRRPVPPRVLSRRWRRAFAEVDVVSFVDNKAPNYDSNDDCDFHLRSSEQRSRNGDLIDDVNAALLCRRRCAGHCDTGPPRTFRVHFALFDAWDEAMVNQWLRYLLKPRRGTRQEELVHLDLRLQATIGGEYLVGQLKLYDDDDECPVHSLHQAQRHAVPARLFSCAALCAGPSGAHPSASPRDAPAEQHRHLGLRRQDPTAYQQLPAPRQPHAGKVRLHREKVSVDASELRVLEYRGAVPGESSLTLHGANKQISSCTIGFCGRKVHEEGSCTPVQKVP
uniref:Uncharacterized protein n=1 Tax=Avena sativa TaxID=4498 RepID=A0ACD5Z058_AVESA